MRDILGTAALILAAIGFATAAYYLWRRSLTHAREAERLGGDIAAPDAFGAHDPNAEDGPLLLTEVWQAPSPPRDLRWAGAFGGLLLPGAIFFLHGPTASALLWLTAFAAGGGLFVAARWPTAGWIAALGASVWALASLFLTPPEPHEIVPPLLLAGLAVGGLIHMRRELWAGLTLVIGMAATAGLACHLFGAATFYGAALAFIVLAAAISGSVWRTHEPALATAWCIALAALFVLSGQADAETWLAPACVTSGALFVAIQAVALPARGRDALLHAATGAVAAPFAAGVLYGAGVGPSMPFMEAGSPLGEALMAGLIFAIIAAAQGAILHQCVRRLGSLSALGFAVIPPALAIGGSLIAACVIALPTLWSAPALALCAIGAALVEKRASNPMWNVLAIVFTFGVLVQAARAGLLLLLGVSGELALLVIAVGIAAPAALAGFAARIKGSQSSWTSAALEAAALALGLAAATAFVRWIASGGNPSQLFISFVEAGVLAAVWMGLAFPLLLREARGAFFVRRGAVILMISAAWAALLLGPFSELNPWWGERPSPALGLPALNLLALGYGAPLAAFAALAWIAHRRVWRRTRAFGCLAAALIGTLWFGLEIRRAFHGADLHFSSAGVSGVEAFALSMAALAAAAVVNFYRRTDDPIEPGLALMLAAAIFAKAAFIDLHIPPDGWRAASFAVLAAALAALAWPREEAPRRRPPFSLTLSTLRRVRRAGAVTDPERASP